MVERKRAVMAATCLCAGVLAGCVGVTDQYVNVNPEKKKPANFADAIDYAHAAKDEYAKALQNQGYLSTVFGTLLIPLGTAAFGFGLGDNNPGLVSGLGLTGLGAYGVATWLRNPPAQNAYILGREAIICAITAIQPLDVRNQLDYPAFTENLPKIDQEIATVQTRIVDLRLALSRLPTAPRTPAIRADAEREITTAEALVATAMTVADNGVKLRMQIASAGQRLVTAVDKISVQVDQAVMNNQVSLSALPGLINGLAQGYATFGSVPNPRAAAPAAATVMPQAGDPPIQQLVVATGVLRTTVAPVSRYVNAVADQKPLDNLAGCGVDPTAVATPITLDPPGPLAFVTGEAKTLSFEVLGGRGPYGAQLAGAPAGIQLRQVQPFGAGFIVEANTQTVEGTTVVSVYDGAERRKTIEIVVAPKPAANAGGADGTGAAGTTPAH